MAKIYIADGIRTPAGTGSRVFLDNATLIDFLEEKLNGTATYNATVTGTVNFDLSSATAQYMILTGNTTATFTNTPASGKTIVREYLIKSTTTQSLGITNATKEVGAYVADGSINRLIISASNFPTIGLYIVVSFENLL